jgi:hypothetical protein
VTPIPPVHHDSLTLDRAKLPARFSWVPALLTFLRKATKRLHPQFLVEESKQVYTIKFYHQLAFDSDERRYLRTLIEQYREGPVNVRIDDEWVMFDLKKG